MNNSINNIEPPPGRPSGAAELSAMGFGAKPHQLICLICL